MMLVTFHTALRTVFITTALSSVVACTTTTQPTILRKPTAVLRVVGDVGEDMAKLWETVDRQLTAAPPPVSPKDTFLISISSRGGRVDYMKKIIGHMQHIQKLGYKIQCVATMACSSAFMIWMECDERYTYQYGYLMFHYPRYGVQEKVDYQEAKQMYESLAMARLEWLILLDNKLGNYFTSKEIDEAALASRDWTGEEFCNKAQGFCKVLK